MPFPSSSSRRAFSAAFTLVELLVSMAVLTLLIVLITQLVNSATAITTTGNKHMDADGQGRPVLDRMAIDFGQMVKRTDIDYFLKQTGNVQTGNDQIAFFTELPGYFTGTTTPSSVSLVAYRILSNSSSPNYGKLQRMGKGLQWNGGPAADSAMVYSPLTIAATWPAAANMGDDPDYEVVGPQVFRLEYSYLLKNGELSDTPWISGGANQINGLQDVATISVSIAVIDQKSKILVNDASLVALAGQMNDFDKTKKPGDMEAQWQAALDASSLPRIAASAIRIYQRSFYLTPRF